jgi:hypothetical protein
MLTILSHAQKWTYKSAGNEFDGAYKVAKVVGTGGKFPYQSPTLIVNYFARDKSLNIYLTNAGYAGCDDKSILLKFDNDEKLYSMNTFSNSDNDVWFLDDSYNSDLTTTDLLQKLKAHSFLYIRVESGCGQADYKFSLSGSTKAIDYVTVDYLEELSERSKIEDKRVDNYIREEEAKEAAEEVKTHIFNGGKVKCISRDEAYVYNKPDVKEDVIAELIKGDSIVVSYVGYKSGFYKLHSSTNLVESVEKDTYYYVTLSAILEHTCLIEKNE